MAHGHFSNAGPYRYDDRAAFYRQQEAERAEHEAVMKSARWIAGKMGGQQFASLPALQQAVIALVTTILGGEPDDAISARIKQGCVLLWLGQCEFDTMYRRCVVRSETGVTFRVA